MKILLLSAALLFSTLFLFSCKKDNPIPPEDQPQINLTLEDVSCTEAWLKLTAANINLPAEVTLKQDDSIIQNIILSNTDTLLYVDSLLPNHSYKFQSVIQTVNKSSNSVNVTTMDTTSHNFTFETFTFGGTAGSSTLYDVAIIDENNIWAVGEIYVADTSVNGYTMYNAVHWDGNNWELKRLNMHSSCNPVTFPPLKAICAFSDSDIIVTSGGSIGWFNGVTNTPDCSIRPLLTGSINKIWGVSSDNFYTVGNNGFIAHYQNGQWSRIESRTDLNFLDIYGTIDPNTNGQQILAVCTNNYPLGKAIFKIDGNSATQISSAPIQWELYSCWFIPNRHYYVVGDGIYGKQNLLEQNWKDKGFYITHYATTSIRGYGFNDVFIVGAFGEFLHFNGFTWKSYLPELGTINGSYGSVGIKGNLVAVTGFESAKAKIIIGRR